MKDINLDELLSDLPGPEDPSDVNDEIPIIPIDDEILKEEEELYLPFFQLYEVPGQFPIFVYDENDLVLLPKYLKSLSEYDLERAVVYIKNEYVDIVGNEVWVALNPPPKELTDFINQKKAKNDELNEVRNRGKIITELSITETFELFGHKIHGLNELSALASIENIEHEGLHVYKIYERYPIFDSCDFIYENRSYQIFFVRDYPLDAAEIQRLNYYPVGSNYLRAFNNINVLDLPAVYYFGDGTKMHLAIKKLEQSSNS